MLKAFFKGRARRDYAPFGKAWKFGTRFETAAIFIFLGFTAFYIGILFLAGGGMILACLVPYLFICSLAFYGLRDNICSLISLGSMTDAEYEKLCREYREFKEKNIVRYGIITSYGIVTDDGMLPWSKITKIKITPKMYGYRNRQIPPMIRYTIGKGLKSLTLTVSLDQEYNLSDEIERFLDLAVKHTDPHCFIENEYYFQD